MVLPDIFVAQLSFVTVTNERLRTYPEEVESLFLTSYFCQRILVL
jgi:hypothetical protein